MKFYDRCAPLSIVLIYLMSVLKKKTPSKTYQNVKCEGAIQGNIIGHLVPSLWFPFLVWQTGNQGSLHAKLDYCYKLVSWVSVPSYLSVGCIVILFCWQVNGGYGILISWKLNQLYLPSDVSCLNIEITLSRPVNAKRLHSNRTHCTRHWIFLACKRWLYTLVSNQWSEIGMVLFFIRHILHKL